MKYMESIPFFGEKATKEYDFFEPKPVEKFTDSNLEGCLAYATKSDNLADKHNLYQCEYCT